MSNKEQYIKQLKDSKKQAFLKSNKSLREYKNEDNGLENQHQELKEKREFEGKTCWYVKYTPYSPITELYDFYVKVQKACGNNLFKITNISERKALEEIENDSQFDKYCQDFWEHIKTEELEFYNYDKEGEDKYKFLNPSSEEDTKFFLNEMKTYINRKINQIIKIRENNYLEKGEFYLP